MPSSTWAGALLSGLGNRDASAIHRRDKPATWRRSFMHFSPFRATRSCVWRRLAAGGCVSVACSTPTHSRSSGLAGERLEAERGGGCGSREILGGAALQSADSSSMPSPMFVPEPTASVSSPSLISSDAAGRRKCREASLMSSMPLLRWMRRQVADDVQGRCAEEIR
jgi:hypothetical protein